MAQRSENFGKILFTDYYPLKDQEGAIVHPPENKVPVSPVPEAGQKEDSLV